MAEPKVRIQLSPAESQERTKRRRFHLRDLAVQAAELAEVSLEPLVHPFLVRSHQPRVARNVSGENCGSLRFAVTALVPQRRASLGTGVR